MHNEGECYRAVRTKICRARKRFKEIPVIAKMYAEIFSDTYIQAA